MQIIQESMLDFKGGLNLRANPFQLAENETPDCIDVDIDPVAGFRRRKAFTQASTLTAAVFDGLWVYTSSTGGQVRMAAVRSGANTLIKNLETGATVHTIPAGKCRAVTYGDVCYVVSENAAPFRYNGSAIASLSFFTQDLEPNPTSPVANGAFPRGKTVAVWNDVVWVANTTEADGTHPNRVRYSWPGFAEYWGDNYFDLDSGEDHDEITAIVPHGERLLVFKRKSVYAISGTDPDSFRRDTLSKGVGAISAEAVCVSDFDVYFADWPHGVYQIQYQSIPKLLSMKLTPIFSDGRIPSASLNDVTVGWGNKRVWVGVPWRDASQGRTLMYDPQIDCWSAYSFRAAAVVPVYPSNAADYCMAVAYHSSSPTTGRVVTLDDTGSSQDLGSYSIPAFFQTRWVDGTDPVLKKRFRRCGFVFNGNQLNVKAYTSYRMESSVKSFSVKGKTSADGGSWGENWGSMVWSSGEGRDDLETKEGVSIGSGTSMSLVVSCPLDTNWGVSAVTVKYIPKRRRA